MPGSAIWAAKASAFAAMVRSRSWISMGTARPASGAGGGPLAGLLLGLGAGGADAARGAADGGGRGSRARGRSGGLGGRLVALLEALDAAGRVDQLLLAGEERVALRADLEPQLGVGRPGLERLPAGAGDGDHVVLGVNPALHGDIGRGDRRAPRFRSFWLNGPAIIGAAGHPSQGAPAGRFPGPRTAPGAPIRLPHARHGVEELLVALALLHALDEQLHRLHRRQGVEHLAQDPGAVQLLLREEQLLLAGSGAGDLDRRVDAPVGEL